MAENLPDGWFRVPGDPDQLRYWDGAGWTGERMAAPAGAGSGHAGPKTKGFILPVAGAVVALVVLGFLVSRSMGSGGDENPAGPAPTANASVAPTQEATTPPPSGVGKTVPVGETLELGGTDYKVTSVKKIKQKDDEDNTYVAVELEVVNHQDETKTFPSGATTLIGGNNEGYASEGDAAIDAGYDDSLLFNPIKPDETSKGVLVFDVPLEAANGAKLEVKDLFGPNKAYVDLGL